MARKFTYEEVKHYIEVESDSGCKLLSKEYMNSREKLKILCKCGEIFKTSFSKFKHRDKKQCNKCGIEIRSDKKRLDYNDVKQYIEIDSKSGCKLISNKYTGQYDLLTFQCKCGNVFETTFDNFKNSHKQTCNKCSGYNRWTYDKVKNFIEVESGSDCKLLSKQYKNNTSNMLFQCKCGSIFKTTLKSFQKGKRHCDQCGFKPFNKQYGYKKTYTYENVKKYIHEKSKGTCILISDEYNGCYEKIILKCSCGNYYTSTFAQVKAINQFQCPECSNREKAIKQAYSYEYVKDFIENKSNSECILLTNKYTNAKQNLDIKCKCGKIFTTTFDLFIRTNKRQCNDCGHKIIGEKLTLPYEQIKNNIEFKNECKLITKKDNYINTRTPIIIECKCGNQYSTTYFSFIQSKGQCPQCAYEDISLQNTKTHEEFMEEVYNLVNNEYTVLSKYINAKTKVKIKHNKCGNIWNVTPDSFLNQKTRCPQCGESKGEQKIREYLKGVCIEHIFQYSFNDCKNINPLPFDFYLPKHNLLIEYDGEQHYKPIDFFGGQEQFKQQQYHDKLKNQYCKDNNIPLLRIPYWDFDNIEQILEEWLSEYNLIHNEDIKEIV